MKSTPMRREFSFNGLKLPDPNPQMSVEDVRGVLSMQYPEIATAAISILTEMILIRSAPRARRSWFSSLRAPGT
jgi:hypothetical protein